MQDIGTTHPYLQVTCHSAPTQIEGITPEGDRVYFRFRYGYACVQINGKTAWEAYMGDSLAGALDTTIALRLTAATVDLHNAARDATAYMQANTLTPEATAIMQREFEDFMRRLGPRPE